MRLFILKLLNAFFMHVLVHLYEIDNAFFAFNFKRRALWC